MHITDIQNNKYTCDCLGCAIGAGEISPPGGLICESEHFVVHPDPEVPIRGFLIIATKKHIQSIVQMSEAEAAELFSLVYQARLALEKLGQIHEVRIIQEERSGHFHLWLLPWDAWMDEKFTNSLASVRDMMRYAKVERRTEENVREVLETVEAIKASLSLFTSFWGSR
jgi:diadenosine tetraphosphate (Ap4A) HIT family hydrolase